MAKVLNQASLRDVLKNHIGDEGHVCGEEISPESEMVTRGMCKKKKKTQRAFIKLTGVTVLTDCGGFTLGFTAKPSIRTALRYTVLLE